MILVRAGETGFDSSFSHPPTDRMVAAGAGFHVGYVSTPPSDPRKNITAAECRSNIAAGMKQLIVFEKSAARANLGAPAGAQDGADARRLVRGLGYPDDVPVLTAVDTGFHPNQPLYCRAYADACGPMGIYGGTTILERTYGLWQIGWVPVSAYSWSGAHSVAEAEAKARVLGAHCLQYKSFMLEGTWLVDPNIAIADFPAWGQSVPAPPPPPPPTGVDDDMPYCKDADTGKFWAIFFDAYAQRVACPLDEMPDSDWEEFAAVQEDLGPLKPVRHAALQRLYDKRGRPQLPPVFVPISGKLTDHDHNVDEIVATTTISGRTGGVIP